jgi:glyoxylase-like metal-dependent hydrolase (beta-lactamase superfamily II)
VPGEAYDAAAYRLKPARVTRHLGDGDVVDLGGPAFTVLHLPGHSPGSIALLDEHNGAPFSGDVLYDDVLLDSIAGADPRQYAASLGRLRDLPVRIVYPGHGPSFGPGRMRAIIDRYLVAVQHDKDVRA